MSADGARRGERERRRFRIGEWSADPETNELWRGNEAVRIEPKAMDVLMLLADRVGRVVSREELLVAVWPGVVVGDEAITQTIIKLRKALRDDSRSPSYIETIAKRGYRLIAPVRQIEAVKAIPAGVDPGLPAQRPLRTRRYIPSAGWVAAIVLTATLAGAYFFHSTPRTAATPDAIETEDSRHPSWSTMSLSARVGERGRVAFNGSVAANPVSASGQLDVSGLDLVTLRPYVESHVNVSLTGGALAAKGKLAVDVPERAPIKAAWNGNLTVSDFAALDKPTASDLARWKRLAIEGIDVATEPFGVAIGRIDVEDYYARLIVYQDGTLNIMRLLTPGAEPEPAPDAKPSAPPTDGAPTREALPITVGRITLARGSVNFSDFFVRPNYSANLTDVTGSVTTMAAEQAGDIAIAARIDSTAPVEVSGRIHPFAKELSLDIAAKARDVDLPPLTPYAVKYAGYGIERGKLTFDVHYRVENRKLAAENRLVLDQLTFNPQRVDSPTATKLPVLLAVSLLKDARGVIDIQLPISGSLDDPQFSVGYLIIRVIVNLITKAATAPFALLSAAFGRGEELSTVPFAPGSAALDAETQKRLDTLGKALADRPALKLDIGGRADPAGDREALRRAAVESAMKREKMKSMASADKAPASVDLVTIDADERLRWLTAAYRESSIKERPRNVIGILKDLPPPEMEAILLADAKVDDDALRLLANARAQVVKDALAAKGIAGERLFLTAPRLSDEGAAQAADAASGPSSRVDLALR